MGCKEVGVDGSELHMSESVCANDSDWECVGVGVSTV